MQSEVFSSLINDKLPAAAWCILFADDSDRENLNAVIGDACGHNQTISLLLSYKRAKQAFSPYDFDKLGELASSYLREATSDVHLVKTVAEVERRQRPPELTSLLQRIQSIVGYKQYLHLSHCYANRANAGIYRDELGSLQSLPCESVWRVVDATSGVISDKSTILRAACARHAVEEVTQSISAVTSDQFKKALIAGDVSHSWSGFWDQVAAAMHLTRAEIVSEEGQRTPVLNPLVSMLAVYRAVFEAGLCLITQHRRIKIVPEGEEPSPFCSDDELRKWTAVDDKPVHRRYTYELTSSHRLLWVPNKETGRFEHRAVVPTSSAECEPGLCLDMPSYYRDGQTGTGLQSGSDAEYFAALTDPRTDIVWTSLPVIAEHPPIPSGQSVSDVDPVGVFRVVCPSPSGFKGKHCRTWCDGFSLLTYATDDGPSLSDVHRLCKELSRQYGLEDNREFSFAGDDEVGVRRTTALDCGLGWVGIGTHR